VPDGDGVARDVTRDPVPVGDRLDILRTHSEAVAHRPGGGEPPLPVPGRPHRRPPGPQRTTAWPRRRRPPDRRAGRDELTNAELAAEASLAQPTLATGASTGSTPSGVGGDSWATNGPHAPTGPAPPGAPASGLNPPRRSAPARGGRPAPPCGSRCDRARQPRAPTAHPPLTSTTPPSAACHRASASRSRRLARPPEVSAADSTHRPDGRSPS
jgi:hypothetical protein